LYAMIIRPYVWPSLTTIDAMSVTAYMISVVHHEAPVVHT